MKWLAILGFVLAFVGAGVLIIPFLGWWNNPDLTHMQMFHQYWVYYITAIMCFFSARMIGVYFQFKREKSEQNLESES